MGIPVPQNKLPQNIQRPRVVPANKLPKQYAQSSGKAVPQNKLPQGMKQPEQSGGFWRGLGNQLAKPLASASNLLEDTGKTIGFGIANAIKPELEWKKDAVGRAGIDFLGHQKDVWTGKNKRVYSDIMAEIAGERMAKGEKVLPELMTGIGVASDFILDPLNKVKILGLTQKGNKAMKTGSLALSAADQAKKGQRALLQFGNTNILPSVGNRVLAASTKANDAIRATKYGAKAIDLIPSTSVRPSGVTREEWKVLRDATVAGKNVQNYTKDKAIQFAADIEKSLRDKGAAPEVRSALLHAIEKGDKTLAPQGFDDVFEAGVKFKAENEAAWKALGGSTLDSYGLAHVATDEVADAASQKNLRGAKLFSSDTPQDIHREWVKVDGKVANLKNTGLKYSEKTGSYVDKAGKPANVTQATAKEINEALVKEGKSPLFKEDLPTVVARMGISTGRKQAGVEFLEATKGLEGKAKELANEAYEKMTNVESIRDAIKAFDKVQNLWKAQVLVAPSYHIRNEVGNLWNNFLANVGPDAYVKASALQGRIAKGTLSKADEALVETMKKQGVVGTGQYGGDITQAVADELGGASWNPLSQRFGLYKGNRAVGSAIEDNAKIAHYIQKIGEGFTPKAAAESVKKYLFDYGDLTWTEQNILKRAMPFYTWTRKNVPLQIEQFFNKPGKFSNAATLQRNIEGGVEQPNERYLNDYIKSNTPMRISTNEDGSTSYLLLGQWLPAASAVQILSQNPKQFLEQLSPVYKVPADMIHNRSFFKDTLGEEQPIEKYPNEMKSYLGMDMGAKTANILRNIRILNEIDKLNPGGIFGGKDTPSMIPGGSQNRGARQTPDAPGMTRFRDFIVGKTQTYDPENSKTFYDRDTENRMGEYTQGLDQALKFKNDDQAKRIIKEMEQFQAEREGGANKVLDQYNLMGDRYLDDRFKNKQAEYARKDARDKMKELIKEGVQTQNPELLRQAAQLDPTYLKDAIKAVTEELAKERIPDEAKRKLYELEQYKIEQKMKPFYTK